MKKIIVFLLIISLSLVLFSCNSTQGNFNRLKKALADTEYISYLQNYNIINNKKNYQDSITLFNQEGNFVIGDADYILSSQSQISYDYNAIILNNNSTISGLNTLNGNYIFVFNCDLVREGEFVTNFNIVNYISNGAFTENQTYISDFFNNYRGIIGDDENFINLITLTIYSENSTISNGYSPFPWFYNYPYQHTNTTADYAFMLPNVAIIKEYDAGYYYNTRNLVYIPLQTIYSNAQLDTIDISAYEIGGPNAGELRFYSSNQEPYYLSDLEIEVGFDTVDFLAYAIERTISINTNYINEFKIEFETNDYIPFGENDGEYPDFYTFLNNISPFVKVVIIEEDTPTPPPPTPPDDDGGGEGDGGGGLSDYRTLGFIAALPVLILFVPLFAIGLAGYSLVDSIVNKNNFGETFTTVFNNVINKIIDWFTQLMSDLINIIDKFIKDVIQLPPDVPKTLKYGIAAGIVAIILLLVGFAIYQILKRRE